MTSGPTVKLSLRRVSARFAAAIASLWLANPALATPTSGDVSMPVFAVHQQPDIARGGEAPAVVFAKKNGKGSGGGSGNSGEGDRKEKNDEGDEDSKDKDKKDRDEKDKDEKDRDEKDKDKKDRDEKDKDKKDRDEKDKDKKDRDEKDKDKKDGDDDGGESREGDERDSDDEQHDHDHDRNERHHHNDGEADDRHDHETEEERHDHSEDDESAEESTGHRDEHEHEAGDSADGATTSAETVAQRDDTSGGVTDAQAQTAGGESAASAEPGIVTLGWTPPTENEDGSPLLDLAGYRIYWLNVDNSKAGSMTIDNPGLSSIVIDNLAAGTYEFTMSSVNTAGIESAPSNTITRMVASGGEPQQATAEASEASVNTAPHLLISGNPPEAVIAGQLYLFTPGVESGTGEPPVFMIEGLPHWAGFNEFNGELYGAPADEDIGFYDAITISATDGVVETSLPTFSIEVVAPGAAPGAVTLSWLPPTTNEDGSYLVDLAGYWIYWGNNAGQYTEWMRIDNPGLTTVVIESLVPGDWEFAMTSFNAAGIESSLSNAVRRFVE